MRIRVAVFDLGNVTLRVHQGRAAEAIRPHCDSPDGVYDVLFQSDLVEQVELGEITPQEYYEAIKPKLGLRLRMDEVSRMWSDIFELMPEGVALVRGVRGVTKYLLSNTNPAHVEWALGRWPDLFDCYDGVFLSHELGLRKPDPAIYRAVMRASGRQGAEHVFVDDLAANVEAARGLGWRGVVFESAEQVVAELGRLGLAVGEPGGPGGD